MTINGMKQDETISMFEADLGLADDPHVFTKIHHAIVAALLLKELKEMKDLVALRQKLSKASWAPRPMNSSPSKLQSYTSYT